LRNLAELLFWLLTRIEISGRENIPAQGGVMMTANHMSRLDPVLLFILLERSDATVMAAEKYKKNPVFHWAIESVGGIWLKQDEADLDALRAAREHLKAGGLLGIAPEGTRSRTGALIRGKTGAAYLVDKAGVPVVPVALWGTESVWRQLARLRRPRIYVHIGPAFTLPPVERRQREADLRRNTDEIMCRIAAMLPHRYWGVYADHPRLAELTGEKSKRL
jgi:1-acyl-sn-glycerol-3-phosphate acyltransferase